MFHATTPRVSGLRLDLVPVLDWFVATNVDCSWFHSNCQWALTTYAYSICLQSLVFAHIITMYTMYKNVYTSLWCIYIYYRYHNIRSPNMIGMSSIRFGTFFIFHILGNFIIPIDEAIFFRGVGRKNTNQSSLDTSLHLESSIIYYHL